MDTLPAYIVLVSLIAHAVLVTAFLYASAVDVKTRIVPSLSLALALVAWSAAALAGIFADACPFAFSLASPHAPSWIAESIAGGLAAGGMSLASALAVERRSGAMALGGGDVKLLFVAGLYLGPADGIAMIGAACALALICQGFHAGAAALASRARGRKGMSGAMPGASVKRVHSQADDCADDSVGVSADEDGETGGFPTGFLRRSFAFVPFLTAALVAVLVLSFASAAS